jgi:hypothetical protein
MRARTLPKDNVTQQKHHLYEPQGAEPCHNPVSQEPYQGKVHLAEEQEESKDSHDVYVHAMDLHDPEARDVRVFYALCLVVLRGRTGWSEIHVVRDGVHFVQA